MVQSDTAKAHDSSVQCLSCPMILVRRHTPCCVCSVLPYMIEESGGNDRGYAQLLAIDVSRHVVQKLLLHAPALTGARPGWNTRAYHSGRCCMLRSCMQGPFKRNWTEHASMTLAIRHDRVARRLCAASRLNAHGRAGVWHLSSSRVDPDRSSA